MLQSLAQRAIATADPSSSPGSCCSSARSPVARRWAGRSTRPSSSRDPRAGTRSTSCTARASIPRPVIRPRSCTTRAGVQAPEVRAAMEQLFQRITATVPGSTVVSPYWAKGAHQVSRHGTIAFAELDLADRSEQKYDDAADQVRSLVDGVHVPGVRLALRRQHVLDEQRRFERGHRHCRGHHHPAHRVRFAPGLGLPILTAIFGIGTGIALVHVRAPSSDAELHDGRGGDDRHRRRHRLRAIHRHPLPRGAATRARTGVAAVARRWTLPGGPSCSPAPPSSSRCSACSYEARRRRAGVAIAASLARAADDGRVADAAARRCSASSAATSTGSALPHRSRGGQTHVLVPLEPRAAAPPVARGARRAAVLLLLPLPVLSMRLGFSDAGNGPDHRHHPPGVRPALATGFGPGFNGPLLLAAGRPVARRTPPRSSASRDAARRRPASPT